jgi:outer membrane receptor protein involved in Fe transport
VYPASFLITSQTPAIVKGLDLSASLRVGGNDQISVSALIQSAEIRTSTLIAPNGTPAGQSMNGFSLPNAPYETISGSWEHTIPLNSGAAIVSDIQAYYNSGYYQEPTHNPNTQQKAYTLIDINLTYKCPIRKFVMHSSTLQFCA